MKVLKSVQLFIILLPSIINSSFARETFFSSKTFSCDFEFCYLNASSSLELIDDLSPLSDTMRGIKSHNFYSFTSRNIRFFTTIETRPVTSNLKKIPSELFEKFYSLQTLKMENSEIEELNREDFKAAGNLEELFLSGNKITRLENMAFLHLKQLRKIDLSRNQISLIHDGSFEEMSENIQEIDLSFNDIEKFKTSFFTSMEMKSNNPLRINLSNNNIKEIEPSNLNTSKKAIIELLDLQHNQIKSFDSSDLDIRKLYLSHNQLNKLNVLPTVEKLDVAHNNLTKVFISRLMRELNASNNNIEELECDEDLRIQSLRLFKNKLTSAAIAKCKHANKLEILDLSINPLGVLRTDAFADMTSLTILHLANTKLTQISFGLFSQQSNLHVLNIAHNRLGFIDHHMFTSLEQLVVWDISGNDVTKVRDYESFHQLFPKLAHVALEGNQWNCEYLSKLRLSFAGQGIEIVNPMQPVKNESNIRGIECTTENNNVHSDVNDLIAVVDHLLGQVSELKDNEIKLIADLQHHIDKENDNLNNNLKEKNFISQPQLMSSPSIKSRLSSTKIFILAAVFTILLFLIFLGIQSKKNFLKANLKCIYEPVDSTKNIPMKVFTSDNSMA